jgi:FkbM family methyltransferase
MYLRHPTTVRGRGFVFRQILRRILPPPPASFALRRPGGSWVTLEYREVLGMLGFVSGGFEDPECRLLAAMTSSDTTAFDVGANVGIHAIPMAVASPSGHVIAIEPAPSNARRLRANVAANALKNIEVIEVAVGRDVGVVTLHLADDPAYASTDAIKDGHRETGQVSVQQTTLDLIWEGAGRPRVSLIKIDVEGGEQSVLDGARGLLAGEHPMVMVEATDVRVGAVASLLAGYGYRQHRVDGLLPWNHLFRATDESSPLEA